MSKAKSAMKDELRSEYTREDLGKAARGKYLAAYRKGSNLVLLDPDVAVAFPTPEAVNNALHTLMAVAKNALPAAKTAARTTRKRAPTELAG